MKRASLAILAMLFFPSTASAQVRPNPLPPATAPVRSPGITVAASAVETLEATSARISLRLGSRNNALIYNSQVLQPVIDALVQSGVDRNSIQLPLNFQGPGNAAFATISGEISHPSTESMQRSISTVGSAIVAIPGAVLQDVQITLQAENCTEAQAKARSAAIAQARSKAQSIAKQIGVSLGSVTSISAFDQSTQDNSCSTSYSLSQYGTPFTKSEDYITIRVFANVSMTYAIR